MDTTSSTPSVEATRSVSPTLTPRSAASVDPMTTRPPLTSKAPARIFWRKSMMARNRSASTPRMTIGTRAAARVATPDPVTVGLAAVTPATRSAPAITTGH
jgi:hypothetical protein